MYWLSVMSTQAHQVDDAFPVMCQTPYDIKTIAFGIEPVGVSED